MFKTDTSSATLIVMLTVPHGSEFLQYITLADILHIHSESRPKPSLTASESLLS